MLFGLIKKRNNKQTFVNAIEIQGNEDDGFIKIVPVGKFPNHPWGAHEITYAHIKQMADNLNNSETGILFDYGHESLWNSAAVAAGWSDPSGAEAREDGLYVKYPEFTANAGKMIQEKEYLYFSPVYKLSGENKDGTDSGSVLLSVGLTNTPFMDKEIDHIKNSVETEPHYVLPVTGEEWDRINSKINGLENILKTIHEKEIDSIVNSAVTAFKIKASQKNVYRNSLKQDYEKTKSELDSIPENSVKPDSLKINAGRITDVNDPAKISAEIRKYKADEARRGREISCAAAASELGLKTNSFINL